MRRAVLVGPGSFVVRLAFVSRLFRLAFVSRLFRLAFVSRLFRLAFVSLLFGCETEHGSSPPDGPLDAAVDAPDVAPPPDGPDANPGFVAPPVTLRANVETSPGVFQEVGLADLSCLGTTSSTPPTTITVSLASTVRDFQSDNSVPNASVRAFPDTQIGNGFAGSPFTADANGAVTITIPTGVQRFGLRVSDPASLDTFLFDLTVAPNQASQTLAEIPVFSLATGQTLPALIGVTRTPGTGLVLGRMLDCQGRTISNAIATVSLMPQMPVHVPGANTFYFSSSVGLPVRHNQKLATSEDGRFMVIEVGPVPAGFIQVWGFPSDGDLAGGKLVLIAELAAPIIEDSVSSSTHRPLRL